MYQKDYKPGQYGHEATETEYRDDYPAERAPYIREYNFIYTQLTDIIYQTVCLQLPKRTQLQWWHLNQLLTYPNHRHLPP